MLLSRTNNRLPNTSLLLQSIVPNGRKFFDNSTIFVWTRIKLFTNNRSFSVWNSGGVLNVVYKRNTHGTFVEIQLPYTSISSIVYWDQGRQPSESYCKFNTMLTDEPTNFGLCTERYDRGLYSVINIDIQRIFLSVILKKEKRRDCCVVLSSWSIHMWTVRILPHPPDF